MKKVFLFFFGLTAIIGRSNALAQDTLDILQNTNYYTYGCALDSICKEFLFSPYGGYVDACGAEAAYVFRTDTALTVYGIVAGLIESFPEESVYDTSYDRSIEYLRLYLPSSGGIQWVRQARVHLHHTPISYYADFSQVHNGQYPYIPMYERYFDSAITVTGKFYCGLTFSAQQPYRINGHTYTLEFPEFYLMEIVGILDTYYCRDTTATRSIPCNGSERPWSERPLLQPHTKALIFPILTPPDSTYVPDTVSVNGPTIADRMTGVTPNPAVESAKVVSSIGMNHIDVYSAAGAKIFDQPARGYSFTLDTSKWPAGIYVVRIHTPYGTASKRLCIIR